MIFKTFDSKIDKWTSKIGIFGKSFNELGTAVNNAFKSVIENLDNFDENVGFWESLKNNLFSKQTDKDWLKNSLGEIISKENIDGYIKELDLESAKEKLQEIFDWQEDINNGDTTWNKYFDTCKNGNEYLIEVIKNTDDLSKLTGEDLVKANQQARASTLAHNEAIKAQTLSAKAGKVALQALAMAGNMLVAWGITKGLELAVKGIDNLIHSAEHCKERVDEVMSSYQSTTSSLRESAKEISSLSDRYDQLSKGVGNLGNNISLTEDEFEEYHNITSKIAELYPDLVDGWDAQGNAIVNLTDSVKELNAEYEKSLHNANLTLMESKDDIFKNYENTVNDITKQIEYAEKAMDIVQSKGSFYDVIYDVEGHKTSYYKAFENLGLSVDDMINGNFSTLERQLILKIQSLKDEMDKAAQDVTPLLNAYLSEDVDYQNISDEKLKTALSTFISSLPESLVTEITENGASAGSNFVEGLVDVVKDDDSVQNALIQLLSLDTENLSYEEAKEIIDNYISIIVNALNSIGYNIDPIELQVELGLDIKNVKEDLRNRLSNGTQDLVIDDWVDSLSEDEAKLANSTAFDEALERQKKGLNGAALSAENYSAALDEVKASQDGIGDETGISPLSISQTIDQLNTQLKPAFDSLQSAYQDIFTDDGFALNSIDILSTCDTIKSKLDEMSDPEGLNLDVDYSAFEDFVKVLNNTESTEQDVEDAFDSLATSITQAALSGAEDFETMKAALEDLGVVNNEMVAFDNLINKTNALADAGIDLANATETEMQAFVNESVSAENAGEALALLHLKKALINQEAITTASDCQNILDLATAANIGIAYLEQLNTLMNLITKRDAAHASGDSRAVLELNNAIREFSANIVNNLNFDGLQVDFSGLGKGAKSAGSKAGKDYKDALKEELSDLDSVISGITGKIDDQISSVNSEKDAVLSSIDEQIDAIEEAKDQALEAIEQEREARLDAIEEQRKQIEKSIKEKQKIIDGIQDEIKAMQDANEERKREIDLQKAQYELERMQNQRTKLVYSESKGMHYENDSQGIFNAKEQVRQIELEIEIANKEKQIDLIEKEISLLENKLDILDEEENRVNDFYDNLSKQTESYYDQQIKNLEKQRTEVEKFYESITKNLENQKDKFQELTEILEKAELSAKLKQLGIDEEALLNGSEEEFNKLKDAYMNIVFQLNQGNDEVLSSLRELSGYEGTAPSMLEDSNGKLDEMNGRLNTSNQTIGTVNSSLGETAVKTSDAATNVSNLNENLSQINTIISEEQTAFDTLRQKIDEIITAINEKIVATYTGQAATAIATTTEMACYMLLRDKILEVKEHLDAVSNTAITLDAAPVNALTTAFQLLYDQLLLVSTTLGAGMEGAEEGAVGGIASAIQALNEISLEEGIIAQFTNLKTAIDEVTSAIGGGGDGNSEGSAGGQSSGGKSGAGQSGGKGSKGEGGGGNSLTGAIESMGETAKEVIGEPDAEGDGTVIGEFSALETAVTDVTSAIGGGESEGGEGQGKGSGSEGEDGEGTLIGSIENLGETTEEVLGEPGGEGVIGRFEKFKEPIQEAETHVKGISTGLDEIDGKEVECTIKVNIEVSGSTGFTGSAKVLGSMNLNSAEYNAKYTGASHAEGTAMVSGNWAVQSDEQNALVGEVGRELIVRGGRFFTVGDNGAEMFDIKKGDIVFNHEQTEDLLKHGHISGRGKAYADGTVGGGKILTKDSSILRPLQPGDKMYDLVQKFDAYFKSMDGNLEKLVPNSFYEQNREWNKMADQISYANSVVNNRNVQPIINVGGVNVTCPGVTSQEVMKEVGDALGKQIGHLAQRALQEPLHNY